MQNLELLKKLISFDSQSQNSNKEIVDFIASFFPADKVKITPLKNSENLIYNLEVKFEGQEHDKPLILVSGLKILLSRLLKMTSCLD